MNIILLRHGVVDIKEDKPLDSQEFKKWVLEYDSCSIKNEDYIKPDIFALPQYIVCSSLKRTKETIEMFGEKVAYSDALFNEAKIPTPEWRGLRLKPKVWLVMLRITWLFGYTKNCESYDQARQRAKKATIKLIELAQKHDNILLCGHGVFNRLIRKELLVENWKLIKKSTSKNLDYDCLEYV